LLEELGGHPISGRFREEQIIQAIRRMDAGLSAADVGRELGVNQYTLYRWKKKYGGLEVSDARRLRQLEDENSKLKRMVAEQALDIDALKVALGKNS
jgi:putative transposase